MKNKILLVLFALVVVFTTNRASAYYSPSTGRWLSRDPMGEPGFETLRAASTMPRVGQVASTASLLASKVTAYVSITHRSIGDNCWNSDAIGAWSKSVACFEATYG